jgi:two-component sensor histidine kinase
MKTDVQSDIIDVLPPREKAVVNFCTFAFRATQVQSILDEAVRVCAECLNAPFSEICRFRPAQNDLLVVACHGWEPEIVGFAISVADKTSPIGRAFSTGQPQRCSNLDSNGSFNLPLFYRRHHVLSSVDVVIGAKTGPPVGVFEVASQMRGAFNEQDVAFLTGFANMLAEAVATTEHSGRLRQSIRHMEELLDEKDTLSQELKHRVRNSLHLVYGLLTTELRREHDEASIAAFRSIALRVMGLVQVFDHLLGIGMSNIINFGDYLKALCDNLPELYGYQNVKLICSVEPLRVGLDDATALGIVATELINNAYLHAFPNAAGEIVVALRVVSDRVLLTVGDNGVGFVEKETRRRGMALVRRLLRQVGATLSVQTDNGTTWSIEWVTDPATRLAA